VNIILLGPPGAGKGTQAEYLAKKLKLAHVATGDLFRKVAKEGTPLGTALRSYMEKGLLVPDEITIRLLLQRIAEPDAAGGIIFDGFPRTIAQARALDEALTRESKKIDKVINFEVSREELVTRLSARWTCSQCQAPYHIVNSPSKVVGVCDRCGGKLIQRTDDAPETVKKRLEVYFTETAPLIDYYKVQGKLVSFDGEGTVADVEKRIASALNLKK
jgi:adenylate kinase